MFRNAGFVFLICATAPTVAAQAPALAEGTRVRVEAPAMGKVVGSIERVTRDSIVIWSNGKFYTAPTATLRFVDVSRGKKRGEGIVRGSLIGIAVGIVAVRLGTGGCGNNCGLAIIGYGLGAAGGILGGGIIGAFHPPEKWDRVEIPNKEQQD